MSQQNPKQQGFGRDEMAALLGGGADHLLQDKNALSPESNKKRRNDIEDLSHLSAAQAASLLKHENKQPSHRPGRHRAARAMQHHAVLEELQQEHAEKEQKDKRPESDQDEEEEEDVFVSTTRRRAQFQVVRRREDNEMLRRRRLPRHDSTTSESSGSGDEQDTRRSRYNNNDSDSDSSMDARRQRFLEKKRAKEREEAEKLVDKKADVEMEPSIACVQNAREEAPLKQKLARKEESSSGSEEKSCSESQSSISEEDDEMNPPTQVMAKPLFVPKHKRNTILSQEDLHRREEEQLKSKQDIEEKRKMESRKMVAAVVAESVTAGRSTDDQDEAGGATNAMPDDSDPVDPKEQELERDAWEVRELQRLLEEADWEKEWYLEKQEYERRRQLTDDERLQEDIREGRYQKPGQDRNEDGKYMQRFYHRGAFYMDEEDWEEGDVRYKAKDYAKAATGEDKIDKSALPKVMQVKKFGFARQNTKYKGLAKEDTTDRSMEILPIVKKQKKSGDKAM